MQWKPNVTVAAIIEQDEQFLLVEENKAGKHLYNQPAGHLEQGESLLDAIKREVMEETAWQFTPEYIVGIYLFTPIDSNTTYLRVTFKGSCANHDANASLDEGIIQAVWMTREQIQTKKNSLTTELVSRCLDDYLAGKYFPLDILHYIHPSQ